MDNDTTTAELNSLQKQCVSQQAQLEEKDEALWKFATELERVEEVIQKLGR